MVAMSRVVRARYGNDVKIVFIGPCVAKKAESTEIDEAITFSELRELFDLFKITPENSHPLDFDQPAGGRRYFPCNQGTAPDCQYK
jgi:iron only hydrogenase large subunit-like protein